jgi:DNA-binding NarL/FixJ family response regulator
MVLEGLFSLLKEDKQIAKIHTAINGKEALTILNQYSINIVLLDINLPDINGIDLCLKITNSYPNCKVIVISSFNNKSFFQKIIDYGGKGYLLKNSNKAEIFQAIEDIQEGKTYFSYDIEKSQRQTKILLTRREIDILENISEGLNNQQIAEKLFISVLTVNTHRKTILAKFEVNNTVMLLKKAKEIGYLS